jgi:hypothetical protein
VLSLMPEQVFAMSRTPPGTLTQGQRRRYDRTD